MVEILDWTTKDPLNQIGFCAGVCRNSDLSVEKNIKRAKACIKAGHGRTLEYPDIYFILSGVSARVARQFYTHVIGVTKLQESTRCVEGAEGFNIPTTVNDTQKDKLLSGYNNIMNVYKDLIASGVSTEDAANVLPLGMYTKVIVKMNLRALEHMAHKRMCSCALKEFREIMAELKQKLRSYSEEWTWVCDNLLVPQCIQLGYCPESKSCGKMPKKEDR